MVGFKHLGEIISAAAEVFAPPSRVTVSEAAERNRIVNSPGAYIGPWDNRTAPMMVEPMNTLTMREYSGEIFAGPAQSSKTDSLCVNWIMYSVVEDPMDMILYNPTRGLARDFSMRRLDRLNRDSPKVGAKLLATKDTDNVFDKQYSNGILVNLSWPSAGEFAGRPIPRVGLTDYDRMPDDVDTEGGAYDLASKRTTTFGSFAMTMAESSPSRDIEDPKWIRRTLHQAPPVKGILALYNRGDRRQWYWPCPSCGNHFVGSFDMLTWEKTEGGSLKPETVRLICPHCTKPIHPDQRYDMQLRGRWLKDGEKIDKDGVISGEGMRTAIASFWLNGVAAVFTTWIKLIQTYMAAEQEFQDNGTETALKKFYNNDLGVPYTPKAVEALRLPEDLKSRAEAYGTKDVPMVPHGTRFLLASVDIGTSSFIVQVHGIQPGKPADIAIVDRYTIKLSNGALHGDDPVCEGRLDEDGQVEWVRPGTYAKDWDLITKLVLEKTYPLADGSGRRMLIKAVGCDSGGKAGVTAMAYDYFRRLRAEGLAARFQLLKGDHTPGAPRVRVTFPDSSDAKNRAAAQGDVPVLMVSSNQVKDMLSNRLDSAVPGEGLIKFPEWLEDWFYAELTSEVRTDKGWVKAGKTRNEAWDLLYYCIGLSLSARINIEGIVWENPPSWAAEWNTNSLISQAGARVAFAPKPVEFDWEAMGKELA